MTLFTREILAKLKEREAQMAAGKGLEFKARRKDRRERGSVAALLSKLARKSRRRVKVA